jgi:hypothetical protein
VRKESQKEIAEKIDQMDQTIPDASVIEQPTIAVNRQVDCQFNILFRHLTLKLEENFILDEVSK